MKQSPKGTIKSYADKTRQLAALNPIEEQEIKDGIKKRKVEAATFDHMALILSGKGKKEGEIFLIDGDIEALKELIELVKNTNTEVVRIGVLFRVDGHTTPFCIEKIIDDDNREEMAVYHTDSTAMDIDQGQSMRALVGEISKVAPIFSLGFKDNSGAIARDYKRQSDEYSCATYSLFDIETILSEGFHEFAVKNSSKVGENLFNLQALPPALMSTIQSINGRKDCGTVIRNGLSNFIKANPVAANQKIKANNEFTTLINIFEQSKEENIPNPIVNIMNDSNLEMYNETYNSCHTDDDIKTKSAIYLLDKNKIKEKREELENAIHDRASEAYQRCEESSYEEEIESKEEIGQSSTAQQTSSTPQSSPALTLEQDTFSHIVLGVIVLIIANLMNEYSKLPSLEENKGRNRDLDKETRRATKKDFGIESVSRRARKHSYQQQPRGKGR